jgi:transcriptional antiterminator NusG
VIEIVSFGGQLLSVPNHEIESLRTLVTSNVQFDPVPFVKEGAMVEVVNGPLRGIVGRFVRSGEHARLILSVDLITQAVSIEVEAADVRSPETLPALL